MILFKFMREVFIVINLQDCVRKTRSFCIKTKNPLHRSGFLMKAISLCEQAIFL